MSASTLALVLVLAALPGRPDLVGRVTGPKGEPLEGAHVLIDSARVRQGIGVLGPSCYADCARRAETGRDGGFRIRSLDPELIFRVLVVAEAFRPTFAENVDPLAGPLAVEVAAYDPARLTPDQTLRGLVLDPDGAPVTGATVEPTMFVTRAFSGFSPGIFDPLAVTNLRGEFILTSRSPITSADLRVEGRNVAPRVFPGRKPGANPQRLKMTRGATVTGRLLRDGEAAAGVAIGLVQVNRSSDTFLGPREIGTDARGRFTFLNVAPDQDVFVYGLMERLKSSGLAVPVKRLRVGLDGGTTEVDDLVAVPGHKISGRVLLSNGQPIPTRTRLLIARQEAWDMQTVELADDGSFHVSALPSERYSLNVGIKGYHLSPKNRSVDPNNTYQLVGMIDQDIDGLKVLMEPGER